jgi:hypothetical protein
MRDFIPRLADLFMEGKMPFDRLITRYDFADVNPHRIVTTCAYARVRETRSHALAVGWLEIYG